MGRYQTYRGNPENKQFYLIDQLIGGVNTDFSDDTSNDNEFRSIINFNMDKRGSLYKRKGFGKLDAVSQIFNMFDNLPIVKGKTEQEPNPEETNDNIVYMKMLKNDNNCFRNLSAFSGECAYREYQKLYGVQNNSFKLMIITTSLYTNTSTAHIYSCRLPELRYTESNDIIDTIEISSKIIDLPIVFSWDRNLKNIDTIEYYDKIYFTQNDKCLVCFDRNNDTFSYSGKGVAGESNVAYKPSPMEIRKIGFNVLGDDPIHWVDYKGLTTDSIQGIYLTTTNNIPLTIIPSGGKFRINILYTGSDSEFKIEYKEGTAGLSADTIVNSLESKTGLKVYDVVFKNTPTSEVEIKITKNGSTIDPYYDYYSVGSLDLEEKPVEPLNIGTYKLCEMYNRAVYYKDNTIWFSEVNNFGYVPNYNYIVLPIEPTDKITKIIFFRNVYIIFTKNTIYKMINSFGSPSFQLMPVNLSVGCHAPETVIPIENELYFASPRGLYALKSSEFREGIENLKELDTKIKSITSDVTLYLGETTDPSVRYNGISERAYAIRYKDKYMLFFNTAFQKGDLAAIKNLDALVYQYDLKAFSEIKFPIKPTFLFMVDGAIETFATIPEKEEYTEEDVIINYNFETDLGTNNLIKDLSGKHNDAKIVGDAHLSPGKGVEFLGRDGYIKTGDINSGFNFKDGFTVDTKLNITSLKNATIYNLKQKNSTGYSSPQTFSIFTDWQHGYRGELVCSTSPNEQTQQDTIYYTYRLHRSGTDIPYTQNGGMSLVDDSSSITLIPYRTYNFNMGNSLSKDLFSGSFVVQHDSSGSYSKNWKLSLVGSYPTYSEGYNNGPDQTFDFKQYGSKVNGYNIFGIRVKGRAVAFNGGCTITYTPYFVVTKDGSLSVGERNLYVWINGKKHTHKVGAIKVSKQYKEFSGGEQTETIYYTGQPTIPIDAQFNLKATIAGKYIENVNIAGINFTLPYSNKYQKIEWNPFTIYTTSRVNLNNILKPSYKELAIETTGRNNELRVKCNSEFLEQTNIVNSSLSILGDYDWKFKYIKNPSNYVVEIYQNNRLFGTSIFDLRTITNANRNYSNIGHKLSGIMTMFNIDLNNGQNVLRYTFEEGEGNTITDKSANGLNGELFTGVNWIVEKGIKFRGIDGYLKLPPLQSNVSFTNGFTVEFEAKFDNMSESCKIFDFATATNKCNISCEKIAGLNNLVFLTKSVDNKTYKISKENADIYNRHKWTFKIVDIGKEYEVSLLMDNSLVNKLMYKKGGITNILRKNNYIGKSNNPKDSLFKGTLYNFKVTINASGVPVPVYIGSLYEYDTAYSDFGKPMEVELETKGINLLYPMHIKKLKHIFIKGLGGYNYNDFFFSVYSDGHLVNDSKKYDCYVDELTRQVVYDYTVDKALNFNEKVSLLGNMRLDHTRLGESDYETRKLIVPSKGKNFTIKINGYSDDYLSIESLGFTFKLGKVKEE